MKLSEIKGERSLEVIADCVEFVGELGEDEHFTKLISAIQESKNDSAKMRTALCLQLPPIIRDHKKRIIELMASIQDVPEDEYAKNGNVVRDVIELLISDDEALSFLH